MNANRGLDRVEHVVKRPRGNLVEIERLAGKRVLGAQHRDGEGELRKLTVRNADRRKSGKGNGADAEKVAQRSARIAPAIPNTRILDEKYNTI